MKKFLIPIFITIAIFSIHIIFLSHKPFIPLIWSLALIYLYGKNHLYIAINSYILLLFFFFSDKINFDVIPFNTEMAYSSLLLFLTFFFVFVYQEFSGKFPKTITVLSALLILVIYTIPLFYLIYSINFDSKITKDIIYAMSQTNIQESIEFAESYLSPFWLMSIVFLTIIIGILLLKQEKQESVKIEKSLLIFLLVYMFSNVIGYRNDIRIIIFLKNSAQEYKQELKLFKEEKEKIKTGHIKFNATKTNKGETYIVIIGESLNKNHMGIYGYKRDTTPLLNKLSNTYLKFENAYSNHTHTMPVLSLSLTEANQLNKKTYYESLSIMDILNKADFETYWVSNQNMYGAWDNLVSIIAQESDHLVSINRSSGKTTSTQKFDGEVLKHVKKILEKPSQKNRVVFVHLVGSHGGYCLRYPADKFTKFSNATYSPDDLRINCYDNSVFYNDYVVTNILKLLKETRGVRGLVYMSDHADDVDRNLGHNSGKFTYDMTQIPLIMWFSNEYKNKYFQLYTNLENNNKKLFSNDFFFDTLLGIMNIKTKHYNIKYDLSSDQYDFKDDEAYTLHGKIKYVDDKNKFYIPIK